MTTGLQQIIHPGLLEHIEAQGHFPNTGTVQDFTIVRVDGEPTAVFANLAGHIDLPCAVAALTSVEIEALDKTIADSTHKAGFIAYYPLILASYQFISDGVTYEITGVASDQHDTMTRLILKVIVL